MASTRSLLFLSLLVFLPLSLSTALTPSPRPSVSPRRSSPARPPLRRYHAPASKPQPTPAAPTKPARLPSQSQRNHAPASKPQSTPQLARPPSQRYHAPTSEPQLKLPAPTPPASPPMHRYHAPASQPQPNLPAPTPPARLPSQRYHAPASKPQPNLPAPTPPARPPMYRYHAPALEPQPKLPAPTPQARPPMHRYHAPAWKPQPNPAVPAPTPTRVIASPDQPINNIIDAMIGSGDFGNWINLLMSAAGNSSVSATLFIPDDVALPQPKNPHPYPNQQDFDPFLFAYHAVPRRLSFTDLLALPVGSRLPTLLPGNSLLITNNSFVNFTVNDSPITHPDLYLNGGVSVQGIGEVFDYKRFGTLRGGGVAPSVNRPVMPPPPSPSFVRRPPPYRKGNADFGFQFFPGGISVSGSRRSGHGFSSSYRFPIVLGIGNVIIYTFLAAIP